jgi:hypothetical protein
MAGKRGRMRSMLVVDAVAVVSVVFIVRSGAAVSEKQVRMSGDRYDAVSEPR